MPHKVSKESTLNASGLMPEDQNKRFFYFQGRNQCLFKKKSNRARPTANKAATAMITQLTPLLGATEANGGSGSDSHIITAMIT
jgi:hypothetical protein